MWLLLLTSGAVAQAASIIYLFSGTIAGSFGGGGSSSYLASIGATAVPTLGDWAVTAVLAAVAALGADSLHRRGA